METAATRRQKKSADDRGAARVAAGKNNTLKTEKRPFAGIAEAGIRRKGKFAEPTYVPVYS